MDCRLYRQKVKFYNGNRSAGVRKQCIALFGASADVRMGFTALFNTSARERKHFTVLFCISADVRIDFTALFYVFAGARRYQTVLYTAFARQRNENAMLFPAMNQISSGQGQFFFVALNDGRCASIFLNCLPKSLDNFFTKSGWEADKSFFSPMSSGMLNSSFFPVS